MQLDALVLVLVLQCFDAPSLHLFVCTVINVWLATGMLLHPQNLLIHGSQPLSTKLCPSYISTLQATELQSRAAVMRNR
jgi:hypothetical protein